MSETKLSTKQILLKGLEMEITKYKECVSNYRKKLSEIDEILESKILSIINKDNVYDLSKAHLTATNQFGSTFEYITNSIKNGDDVNKYTEQIKGVLERNLKNLDDLKQLKEKVEKL